MALMAGTLAISATAAAAFSLPPLGGPLASKHANRFHSSLRSLQPARGGRRVAGACTRTCVRASKAPLEPFEPGEAARGIVRKQVPHWEGLKLYRITCVCVSIHSHRCVRTGRARRLLVDAEREGCVCDSAVRSWHERQGREREYDTCNYLSIHHGECT